MEIADLNNHKINGAACNIDESFIYVFANNHQDFNENKASQRFTNVTVERYFIKENIWEEITIKQK